VTYYTDSIFLEFNLGETMIKMNNRLTAFKVKYFLKIAAVSVATIFAGSAQALRFEPADKFSIDLDTTLAYGAAWRTESPKNLQPVVSVNPLLGGPGYPVNPNFPGIATPAFQRLVTQWNSDDGDRNFEKGDQINDRYAITSDMDMRYDKYGFFLRGQMFYDSVYFGSTAWKGTGWDTYRSYADTDCNGDGKPDEYNNIGAGYTCGGGNPHVYSGIGLYSGPESINNAMASGEISDPSHFSQNVKNKQGSRARFLDAYVYGSFDLGGHTLDVRLGRQAISWGEALLLQGGIGFAQNRIDASAATSPGVELKEIFLPTGTLYGQMDLTETLTVEAYWQYEWLPSELFATGAYWSTTDMLESNVFLLNTNYYGDCMFGKNKTFNGADYNGVGGSHSCDSQWAGAYGAPTGMEHWLSSNPNAMFKAPDNTPDDPADQYGLAFRKLLDGGSEAGVYFVQYHDRYPSVWAGNNGGIQYIVPSYNNGGVDSTNVKGYNANKYTIAYAERIKLYGLTYNTVIGDTQYGFEFTYRPNQPIVPACTQKMLNEGTINTSLPTGTSQEKFDAGLTFQSPCKDPSARFDAAAGWYDFAAPAGSHWSTKAANNLLAWPTDAEMFTYNVGVTLVVPPSMFWDTGIFVGELGGFYVGSGYTNQDLKVTDIGAFTQMGSGVSGIFLPQYKNIMEGVDLTIPIFVNYTIDGSFSYYNYNEHALWASIGAEAVYLSNTRVGITYSAFGGRTNMWRDRDNIAITAKYTF